MLPPHASGPLSRCTKVPRFLPLHLSHLKPQLERRHAQRPSLHRLQMQPQLTVIQPNAPHACMLAALHDVSGTGGGLAAT